MCILKVKDFLKYFTLQGVTINNKVLPSRAGFLKMGVAHTDFRFCPRATT